MKQETTLKQNTDTPLPLTPQLPKQLMAWYKKNARTLPWRADTDPYHVWLSEIMLQQTRVEAVKAYYIRFLNAFPTLFDLAHGSEEQLLKLWEGLGYYNRARNLQKAAKRIVEEYNGVFPKTYEDILSLPGIGPYTAGAIASICFHAPTPAVDGNVLRVIARYTDLHQNVDTPQCKKKITESLRTVYPAKDSGTFTQSLMELGATVCLPKGTPKCDLCPLARLCMARKNNTAALLPIKAVKKAKKETDVTVFILTHKNRFAIEQRTKKGLLHRLWQFPNIENKLSPQQVIHTAEAWETLPNTIIKCINHTHIFTHIKWTMEGYYLECEAMPPSFTWVTKEELMSTYALPSAFKPFL